MKIEKLFRSALLATFLLNMMGAFAFIPSSRGLREFGGLPESGNSFYSWILASWIFLFGILYLRLAFTRSQERFFVIIGAFGKTSFALLLAVLAGSGELPPRAALAGLADFIIAIIFFVWLYQTRHVADGSGVAYE